MAYMQIVGCLAATQLLHGHLKVTLNHTAKHNASDSTEYQEKCLLAKKW